MTMGPVCLVSKPCECGDQMRWKKRMFRGWRLECICGRCGPWRMRPETEPARPWLCIDRTGHQFVSSRPMSPPPPKPKG